MLDMIEFCDGEPIFNKIDTIIPDANKLNKIRYK